MKGDQTELRGYVMARVCEDSCKAMEKSLWMLRRLLSDRNGVDVLSAHGARMIKPGLLPDHDKRALGKSAGSNSTKMSN
jgi:hypothetical protein